jgi:molecular chaperone GrpE (heat shock protein)
MSLLHISIYTILLILLILSLVLFFKFYLKIKSSDKNSINLIEFPKETSSKIENFIKENKKNNEELINYLNNQYKDAKSIIQEVDEKIKPFERVAREKNDELKEYKKGYDYNRNKSIIDGVIETIEFIEKAEKKINFTDEVSKSYFLTTKEKLLIVLNNSGIESFEPIVNTSSLDDHSCEVDVVTEVTNDQNKNNFIASTLRKGYRIKTTENNVIYIKKALVRVYEFQNKDDRIN